MLKKIRSFQSISKYAALSILSIALTVSSAHPTQARSIERSRGQSVDSVTDWLFYNVNPELKRRKLQPNDRGYIREWQVIREVVDQGLRFEKSTPGKMNPCGVPEWYFDNRDSALQDRLADAIFYSRNPKMSRKPIGRTNPSAIREWTKLRKSMNVAYC
jgi:hypothetical protein